MVSTLCTVTGERSEQQNGLVDHVEPCEFEGEGHTLLHWLEADITVATKCVKPYLGFINRRGKVRFAVIAQKSHLRAELKLDGFHFSAIKPEELETLNKEALLEACSRIRQIRRIRITDVEQHTCPGAEVYFTFNVDFLSV